MCKAFSCIITEKGKVYWKAGLDSHEDIINLFKKDDKDLIDDKQPPYNTFARVEITPANGNYFDDKQEWIYKIDENIQPSFLNSSHEFICREALKEWRNIIYSMVNIDKARNIIYPFKINPPKITNAQLIILKNWASVRDSVWYSVGDSVGDSVGYSVRDSVWYSVGDSVGAYIGNIFNIKEWKYIDYNNPLFKKGIYPFNSLIELWEQGLVPSFDSKFWRLHGGENAKVLWKGKIEDIKENK